MELLLALVLLVFSLGGQGDWVQPTRPYGFWVAGTYVMGVQAFLKFGHIQILVGYHFFE